MQGKLDADLVKGPAGDLIDLLQREAAVLNMEYAEDCTVVEAVVKPEIWGRVKDFAAPAGEDTP